MKNAKISLSFGNLGDDNFLTKSEHIHKRMTGNPYFTDPVPPLPDIKDAIDAYSGALTDAKGLGTVPVSLKNKAREVLEQLLFQLGMYVMFIANGDETILSTTGFTMNKTPEPNYLTNLGNVTLENGVTSGELIGSVKRQGAIRSYQFQVATELQTETTLWETRPSSKSKYVFTNLIPGKQYWVRVMAVGSKNQVVYSNVATQFVQ